MAKKPKTGLTTKHWFGYMFGDWGGCMTFTLMGSVVTMYYTDILHVNTTVLAILLLVWNITPEVRAEMAARKAAKQAAVEAAETAE